MKSTNLLRVCVLFALAAFALATADMADAGLFDRLRNRGNDCCCETTCCDPEPCCEPTPCCEPEPCCEPAPCCDPCCNKGGFLSRLRNRRGSDCCCEATSTCGCGATGGVIYESGSEPTEASPADEMPRAPEPPPIEALDESA